MVHNASSAADFVEVIVLFLRGSCLVYKKSLDSDFIWDKFKSLKTQVTESAHFRCSGYRIDPGSFFSHEP